MANFIINVEYPSISYNNKTSYNTYLRCTPTISISETVQLLNADSSLFSVLSSYTGDTKKDLVITSISSNDIDFKYNGSVINNSTLPLVIDISSLADTDVIPNLTLEGSLTVNDVLIGNPIKYNNISFYIEDENDQKGDNIVTSFQFITAPCDTLSSITSVLPLITDGDGIINYQLTADNQVSYYDIIGLPTGLSYDITTGLVSGTSTQIGIHPITISTYNEAGFNPTVTTIEVVNPLIVPPSITSPLLLTISEESFVSYRIEATNSPTSFQFILPEILKYVLIPDGFDYLLGKVKSIHNGSHAITITATNDGGTDIKILVLDINITGDYLDGWGNDDLLNSNNNEWNNNEITL